MGNSIKTNVSVIIVTRDRENVLSECIDRLLNDEEQPFEVIVVDSSSTDATRVIVSKFPSVKYYNLGDIPYSMVRSRNIGISLAAGEVVAFIDDDCFVQPGWLSELSKVFQDQDIVAAGGRIIYHPWKVCPVSNTIAEIDLGKDILWAEWDRIPEGVIDVPTLPGGNCAVRRNVAIGVGGFDTNFTGSANLEETDFFYRVSKAGGRIVFVPAAVVEHRAAQRVDNIVRSETNFLYRYSLVRNRLYFLRKHKAAGLPIALRKQLFQLIGGTLKIVWQAVIFFVASFCGLLGGFLVPGTGKSEGLDI